jgi:hypothetical protein
MKKKPIAFIPCFTNYSVGERQGERSRTKLCAKSLASAGAHPWSCVSWTGRRARGRHDATRLKGGGPSASCAGVRGGVRSRRKKTNSVGPRARAAGPTTNGSAGCRQGRRYRADAPDRRRVRQFNSARARAAEQVMPRPAGGNQVKPAGRIPSLILRRVGVAFAYVRRRDCLPPAWPVARAICRGAGRAGLRPAAAAAHTEERGLPPAGLASLPLVSELVPAICQRGAGRASPGIAPCDVTRSALLFGSARGPPSPSVPFPCFPGTPARRAARPMRRGVPRLAARRAGRRGGGSGRRQDGPLGLVGLPDIGSLLFFLPNRAGRESETWA